MAQFVFNNSSAITGILLFYVNYGKHSNISRDLKEIKPMTKRANISVNRLKKLYILLQRKLKWIVKKSIIQVNRKRSKGPDLRKKKIIYLLRKNIKIK